jgi:xylose isomerase
MNRNNYCVWTGGHSGKAGFRPAIRTEWDGIPTDEVVDIFGEKALSRIRKALGDDLVVGIEAHYPMEINPQNAPAVTAALKKHDMFYGMLTPGLHHLAECGAFGGPASLDIKEREAARRVSKETVDLAYSADVKERWDPKAPPTLVFWNGAWGYDVPHSLLGEMLRHLDDSMAGVAVYEKEKGGQLYIAIEPKPNEGHPKMIIPTVASGLKLWDRIGKKFGIDVSRCGVNQEFGHSQMIGLDHAYDVAEQIADGKVVHLHANEQGNDGIRQGGPGMYDVDHGVALTGPNIAIAKMLKDAGYDRWVGHDMQARPHDNEGQALNRVVQSFVNWEALRKVASEFPTCEMRGYIENRDTLALELLIGDTVSTARNYANDMLGKAGIQRYLKE